MSFWSDLLKRRAEDWVFDRLATCQVPEEPTGNDRVVPDEAYLMMTLRSMRIVNVRKLNSRFYGVVHSLATLDHLSGKDASFPTVTTPTELSRIDAQNLDRTIQVNKALLGPVPYRGGKVSLELGLFSVKEADLAAPFLDVLESVASSAGVSVVSVAVPFMEPLKKGLDALTGTSDASILEIGVSTSFEPPKTGWYIAMRARKQEVDISTLRVTPSDFRLVNTTTNQLVEDYPYMVFTVTQSRQRSDWFKVPDLSKPYQELAAAVRKGDYKAAEDLIVTFKRMALTSYDLITNDAVRIGRLVQARAESMMRETMTARDRALRELPPLESYPLYTSDTGMAS